ncbi:BatA domain-containing protein, partial [Rufibacter quisquiliarum]
LSPARANPPLAFEAAPRYIGVKMVQMFLLTSGAAVASLLLLFIHFFGLRLRQKLEFSHIQFLSSILHRSRSVKKLQNVVLLLTRLLFVVSALIAFFLFISDSSEQEAAAGANALVLVDDSWSMKGVAKVNAFSKAELIDQKTTAFLSEAQGGKNQSSIANTDAQTKKTFRTFSELENYVAQQKKSTALFIISDFQKSQFSLEQVSTFLKRNSVSLVSVPSSSSPNFFIDSVWVDQPIYLAGSALTVMVRVAGSQQSEKEQVLIKALVGDKLVGSSQLLLEPQQKGIVKFDLKGEGNSATKLKVVVEDTKSPFDNEYFAVLPTPTSIKIRIGEKVEQGHPVVQALGQEAAFTLHRKQSPSASTWFFDASTGSINSGTAREMKDWLQQGKSLILVPAVGSQDALLSLLTEIGLKGIRAEASVSKTLHAPDLSDPFFRSIFEKQVRNMKMPQIQPLLFWNSAFHTILKFSDNSPFLSSFQLEKGKLNLFSAPLEKETSFAAHPLFVPVLYQLIITDNTGSPSPLAYALDQDEIRLPAAGALAASREGITLRKDAQNIIPEQKVRKGDVVISLPTDVTIPGFYEVVAGEQVLSTVALNIPGKESYLESYSVNELEEIAKEQGTSIKVVELEENLPLQKLFQNSESGMSLWKYCLILCLLCLLAEVVILSAKKRGSLI